MDFGQPPLTTTIAFGKNCVASANGGDRFVKFGDACSPAAVAGVIEFGGLPNPSAAQYHDFVAEIFACVGSAVGDDEPRLYLVRVPALTALTTGSSEQACARRIAGGRGRRLTMLFTLSG